MLAADIEGRAELSAALSMEVPENWPPQYYDRPAVEWMLKYLEESPNAAEWGSWYMILRDGPNGAPVLIGVIGYKGKPLEDGTVEIGYSVLQQFQRQWYASEAASALVERAFCVDGVSRVIAETLPELIASQRVLEKNGFRFIGPGSEEGVIRYELRRLDWRAGA